MDKYCASANESEILPNLLGLTDATAIGLAEFEGFLRADIVLTESITLTTTSAIIIPQDHLPIYFDDALSSHAHLVNPIRPQGGENRPYPPAHGVSGRPSALPIDQRATCP